MERPAHSTQPLISSGHRASTQEISASDPSRTSHKKAQQGLIGQDGPDLLSSPPPKLPDSWRYTLTSCPQTPINSCPHNYMYVFYFFFLCCVVMSERVD